MSTRPVKRSDPTQSCSATEGRIAFGDGSRNSFGRGKRKIGDRQGVYWEKLKLEWDIKLLL